MMLIKKLCIICGKILISSVIAGCILSVFCVFYKYSNNIYANETEATLYKYSPRELTCTMEEGFSWKLTDENGFFNESSSMSENPQILLMGSSHVEEKQIPYPYCLGTLLNDRFPTYNIGISGNFIAPCVNRLDDALTAYPTAEYAIIETFTVTPALKDMEDAVAEIREPFLEHSAPVKFIKKYFAFGPNFIHALKSWSNVGKRQEVPEPDVRDELYPIVLKNFIEKAADSAQKHDVQLIIYYHPTPKLGRDGKIIPLTQQEQEDLNLFARNCKEFGIIFLDMTEQFHEMYNLYHVLPCGFSNTKVGVGHTNRYGQKAIADSLINIIEKG